MTYNWVSDVGTGSKRVGTFLFYTLIIPGRILADDQFSKFIITPEEAMLLNLSDTDWEKWKSLSPGAGVHLKPQK